MPQPAPCGVASVGSTAAEGEVKLLLPGVFWAAPLGSWKGSGWPAPPPEPGGGGGALETGQGALWPWPAPCTL